MLLLPTNGRPHTMKPIPETHEVLDEIGPFGPGEDLAVFLGGAAERVRRIVPSCVGLSLSQVEHGLSFTLEATDAEIATLDGVQYVDGGPCVTGGLDGLRHSYVQGDPLDEEQWRMFASSTAARGLASTLTLPILAGDGTARADQVVGTVNLYASLPHAFDGHVEAVAAVFGAWAEGAVTNADLDFETRRAAQQAPQVLRDQTTIVEAVGLLCTARDLDEDAARTLLEQAALRAGIDTAVLATMLIEELGG